MALSAPPNGTPAAGSGPPAASPLCTPLPACLRRHDEDVGITCTSNVGKCWLASGRSLGQPRRRCTPLPALTAAATLPLAHPAPAELPQYCGVQRENSELDGGDLAASGSFAGVRSVEACCELCRTNPLCGAYTLNLNDQAGVCALKQAAGFTQRPRAGYYSAVFNRTGEPRGSHAAGLALRAQGALVLGCPGPPASYCLRSCCKLLHLPLPPPPHRSRHMRSLRPRRCGRAGAARGGIALLPAPLQDLAVGRLLCTVRPVVLHRPQRAQHLQREHLLR